MSELTLTQAQSILREAEGLNPGPWADHSRHVAETARYIAAACQGLDPQQAYVLGLLHDIGRRFGVTDGRHVLDGFCFLKKLGYPDAARICLTHSFPLHDTRTYAGVWDTNEEEKQEVETLLAAVQYDDYDRLIQLCDAIALPSGPVLIEKRLVDVTLRHGFNDFTLSKWRGYFELRTYFEQKIGQSIYALLPDIVQNTFN
jgi:hypothetical protein